MSSGYHENSGYITGQWRRCGRTPPAPGPLRVSQQEHATLVRGCGRDLATSSYKVPPQQCGGRGMVDHGQELIGKDTRADQIV
ncbi:hypothetical protein ANCDUO_17889 [Ancylostoma duodenale]|uniref:Uncharacterized protein n=1 Tax=Ancylostoma duodenale TaxID=51022 RepID=A0A0C2FTU9_9BILA|nr:hypothetical protein ANCDUO_17889 [Ancylostoma duodenale]